MKLLRPTVIDQVLTQQHLEQAEVVRKGDQVVIIARSGSLSVRMPGEALSKGGLRNRSGYATSTPSAWSRPGHPGQVEVHVASRQIALAEEPLFLNCVRNGCASLLTGGIAFVPKVFSGWPKTRQASKYPEVLIMVIDFSRLNNSPSVTGGVRGNAAPATPKTGASQEA
jgi:hypothetical protein